MVTRPFELFQSCHMQESLGKVLLLLGVHPQFVVGILGIGVVLGDGGNERIELKCGGVDNRSSNISS
jgi:hypothetical protein